MKKIQLDEISSSFETSFVNYYAIAAIFPVSTSRIQVALNLAGGPSVSAEVITISEFI